MRARPGSQWHGFTKPNVVLGPSTVVRVVDRGEEDPEFVRRPVGFVLPAVEPLLWEGDNA